jgi:hypothetical protein
VRALSMRFIATPQQQSAKTIAAGGLCKVRAHANSSAVERGKGEDLLRAIDERARIVAEEVFRELAQSNAVGAVKVKTATLLLDMNESRVRQLIREGKLKVIHPTPRTIRIPLSEIRRFTEDEK